MRCPKCGYISFDSVDECVKCKKNIKSATEVLQGSVLRVASPNFLQFRNTQEETVEEESGFADEISPLESEIVVEESEEFLPDGMDSEDEEDGEIELSPMSFNAAEPDDEIADVDLGEEEDPDGEIEVDLSQFEEVSDPEASFLSKDEDEDDGDVMQISLPDELSDMSDLAPPAASSFDEDDDDSMDLDLSLEDDSDDLELDGLNFDLELDDVDASESVSLDPVQETVLSLDDIEFSGDLSDDEDGGGDIASSMDSDLDFDLDLGGLSIHKDV